MFLRRIIKFNFASKTFGFNTKSSSVPKNLSFLKRTTNCRRYFLPGTIAFITLVHTSSSVPSKLYTIIMAEEQVLKNLLQNADQLFDENHFQENIELLNKHNDQSLPDIQWRKARAIFSVAKAVKDAKEKATLIRQSYELIDSAIKTDDENFAIHKWYSIILDAHAELDGIKSRISQLEVVKKHMLKAVELNPDDPTSWYILGAFEYNLADLPWIQRKIVSTIFASPPSGTYEQALEYFDKAETIKEGFYSMNWLMLGKCNMALKNMDLAKDFLQKAANCPVLNEDDKNCKEEACKLLKKF